MNKSEVILTAGSIRAIADVLLTNSDICELYEKRGVTRAEVRLICILAEEQVEPPRKSSGEKASVQKPPPTPMPTHGKPLTEGELKKIKDQSSEKT